MPPYLPVPISPPLALGRRHWPLWPSFLLQGGCVFQGTGAPLTYPNPDPWEHQKNGAGTPRATLSRRMHSQASGPIYNQAQPSPPADSFPDQKEPDSCRCSLQGQGPNPRVLISHSCPQARDPHTVIRSQALQLDRGGFKSELCHMLCDLEQAAWPVSNGLVERNKEMMHVPPTAHNRETNGSHYYHRLLKLLCEKLSLQ